MKELESRFVSVKVHSPDASRDESSEVYVISKGFLASKNVVLKDIAEEEKKPEFTTKGGNF
jgi:23S rRNA (uridine2552-2'-O)-methyltransferase